MNPITTSSQSRLEGSFHVNLTNIPKTLQDTIKKTDASKNDSLKILEPSHSFSPAINESTNFKKLEVEIFSKNERVENLTKPIEPKQLKKSQNSDEAMLEDFFAENESITDSASTAIKPMASKSSHESDEVMLEDFFAENENITDSASIAVKPMAAKSSHGSDEAMLEDFFAENENVTDSASIAVKPMAAKSSHGSDEAMLEDFFAENENVTDSASGALNPVLSKSSHNLEKPEEFNIPQKNEDVVPIKRTESSMKRFNIGRPVESSRIDSVELSEENSKSQMVEGHACFKNGELVQASAVSLAEFQKIIENHEGVEIDHDKGIIRFQRNVTELKDGQLYEMKNGRKYLCEAFTEEQEEKFIEKWNNHFQFQMAKLDLEKSEEKEEKKEKIVASDDTKKLNQYEYSTRQAGTGQENNVNLEKMKSSDLENKKLELDEERKSEKSKTQKQQLKEEENAKEVLLSVKQKSIKVSKLINDFNFSKEELRADLGMIYKFKDYSRAV